MKKQHSIKTNSSSNLLRNSESLKKISISKKQRLESNRSIDLYKCGCKDIPIKSILSIRQSEPTKIAKKNKLLFNKPTLVFDTHAKPKLIKTKIPNNSEQFKQLVKTLNILKKQFKSLEKTIREDSSIEIIETVPREVIKSIDKIKKVERPVEKIIKKIKKVSQQVIVYNNVNKQVIVPKQQLVFVDSQPLPPLTQYVQVPNQIIRTVPVLSNSNQRMRSDLEMFTYKSQQILSMIQDSHTTISQLRTNIRNLQNSYNIAPSKPNYYDNTNNTYNNIQIQTQTILPSSYQDIAMVSPIKPRSQLLIQSNELLSTSFLTSMVSINNQLCGEIYQRNPEDVLVSNRESVCSRDSISKYHRI